MPEIVTIRGEGIALDLLLHRRYGVRGRQLLEQTYELNPGLASLGDYLPLGTVVVIPDLPAASSTTRTVITLFG